MLNIFKMTAWGHDGHDGCRVVDMDMAALSLHEAVWLMDGDRCCCYGFVSVSRKSLASRGMALVNLCCSPRPVRLCACIASVGSGAGLGFMADEECEGRLRRGVRDGRKRNENRER